MLQKIMIQKPVRSVGLRLVCSVYLNNYTMSHTKAGHSGVEKNTHTLMLASAAVAKQHKAKTPDGQQER